MILIVTNRKDYTADFLILELRERGLDFVRFNTEDFPTQVTVHWQIRQGVLDGYFRFPNRQVDFDEIKSIWYRRPVRPVIASEIADPTDREFAASESQAALEGIWRSLDCFWVSHPDNLRRAEFKLNQLKVASQIGFAVPPTIITSNPDEAKTFYEQSQKQVIYKPLYQGRLLRGDEFHLIYTNPVDTLHAERFERVQYAPTLLQTNIPKQVEIRVTVIGMTVFAVEIHSQENPQSENDWRHTDARHLPHQRHSLPPAIETQCLNLVRTLELAFGAIDLILTPEGKYIFLEINPNGQWAWIEQICPEIPLRKTLADLLNAGCI